jgi:hypothetical protein
MQTFNKDETEKFLPFFNEHGWLHIKNMFSAAEIEEFREKAYAMKALGYTGDLLANEPTSSLIYDSRIIDIIKLILKTDKPVYFGDSSGSNIGNVGAAGFHKDNPDKFNGNNPDWQSDYTIIRMGIYCQSHDEYSGSVALRDKSHTTVNSEKGKPFLVNNKAGDLVIWSLRTSHSGNSLRSKLLPNFFVHPWWYHKLPGFLFRGQEKERVAYFMTYGKDDKHLRRYLTYLLKRRYMVETWKQNNYSQQILDAVKQKGNLKLIDMYSVVKDLDIATVKKEHTEMEAEMNYFEPKFYS